MFKRMILLTALLLILTLGAVQPRAAQAQDETALTETALRFLELMNAGEIETAYALFDSSVQSALTVDQLSSAWTDLLAQLGGFQAVESTQFVADQNLVVITTQFGLGTFNVLVNFAPEGSVVGFFIQPAEAPTTPEFSTPPYADADAYTEIDVTIGEGTDYPLPGTLTLPANVDGPVPAVVIVHGSGPNDRDGTLGATKPYRDLAWGLAAQGIAVLRYDKRTLIYGAQMSTAEMGSVYAEMIDDAVLAVALLRQTDGIDPERVFVLGHSLGGQFAPLIASEAPEVAGVIIAAGATAGETLSQTIVRQVTYLVGADGDISVQEQAALDETIALAAQIDALTPDSDPTTMIMGAPAAYWLEVNSYDMPAATLAIAQPILVVQGQRDYQATVDQVDAWQAAIGDRPNTTVITYPCVNHALVQFADGACEPGLGTPADYEVAGNVFAGLIDDIAAWIAGQ